MDLDKDAIHKLFENDTLNYKKKSWYGKPTPFTNCKISAVALIKMAMHARSGGDIEVMGFILGFPKGDTMYVMDVYGLPAEASETRVTMDNECYAFAVRQRDYGQQLERFENVIGWYHSHPGYGCWLSGIDVKTTNEVQKQFPGIAIVVDPKQTISSGKVEIGAFRCYPDGYKSE